MQTTTLATLPKRSREGGLPRAATNQSFGGVTFGGRGRIYRRRKLLKRIVDAPIRLTFGFNLSPWNWFQFPPFFLLCDYKIFGHFIRCTSKVVLARNFKSFSRIYITLFQIFLEQKISKSILFWCILLAFPYSCTLKTFLFFFIIFKFAFIACALSVATLSILWALTRTMEVKDVWSDGLLYTQCIYMGKNKIKDSDLKNW